MSPSGFRCFFPVAYESYIAHSTLRTGPRGRSGRKPGPGPRAVERRAGTGPGMFEHRTEPLLPRHRFAWRALGYLALSAAAIGVSLGAGVLGYHFLGGLHWIDALLNASMILGGMGPVDPITSPAGKLFAAGYALFSGLLVIGAASILLAPFVHRIMHGLHIDRD